ncbi:hypothetical protein AcV7_007485 [Taiwanofungus camphoratus]|nr:hypothetical protein AcV7_007485 [Antrodia cinnamomea]
MFGALTKGPFPAPDVIAHDQAGLLVFGNQYRITRAFWIMSLALMVYDYCLTFNDELRYMWEGRFVWTRVLFWMNRYWPMANLIFDNIILGVAHPSDIELCSFWFKWFFYANMTTRVCISAILILRLHVMFNCDRRLLITLCALFCAEFAAESTIMARVVYSAKVYPMPPQFSKLTGCVPIVTQRYAWAYWLPVLVFESIMLSLSVVKSVRQAQEDTRTPYVTVVLLRDSVVYYGGIIGPILINCIVWKSKVSLFFAFVPTSLMMNSILGCRMLLNIQKAGKAYHDYRLCSKAFHAETVDTILHIRRLNYRGSDRSRMN